MGGEPNRVATLGEIAEVVRSKNAGPYHLTFDVMFAEASVFRGFLESRILDEALIQRTYGVPQDSVSIIPYPPANAVKITIPRLASSGSPEDRDVYGAQQHGPLLELEIDIADATSA